MSKGSEHVGFPTPDAQGSRIEMVKLIDQSPLRPVASLVFSELISQLPRNSEVLTLEGAKAIVENRIRKIEDLSQPLESGIPLEQEPYSDCVASRKLVTTFRNEEEKQHGELYNQIIDLVDEIKIYRPAMLKVDLELDKLIYLANSGPKNSIQYKKNTAPPQEKSDGRRKKKKDNHSSTNGMYADQDHESKNSTLGDGNRSNRRSKFDKFPRGAQKVLREWFFSNFDNPYPSKEEKRKLCEFCDISMHQLNQWFTNTRLRIWKPAQNRDDNYRKNSPSIKHCISNSPSNLLCPLNHSQNSDQIDCGASVGNQDLYQQRGDAYTQMQNVFIPVHYDSGTHSRNVFFAPTATDLNRIGSVMGQHCILNFNSTTQPPMIPRSLDDTPGPSSNSSWAHQDNQEASSSSPKPNSR